VAIVEIRRKIGVPVEGTYLYRLTDVPAYIWPELAKLHDPNIAHANFHRKSESRAIKDRETKA
jgi:oligoribonuclease (3'-5' exoribonuclease)